MSRWPLTARGLGALALAGVGVVAAHLWSVRELLYISVLLAAAVVLSAATLVFVGRRAELTRTFHPDVASVGGEVDVIVRVTRRSPLPIVQGWWHEKLPDGVRGEAAGQYTESERRADTGARSAQLRYSLACEQRGLRTIGPLSVTMTDPYGLARRTLKISPPRALTVTPALVGLAQISARGAEGSGTSVTAADRIGQGSDNLIPRHYVPGDSTRRIHWRSSAHRDQLMVRQEEQEVAPEAVVVLDLDASRWAAAATRPGDDPAFESAVSACLSAAARLVDDGYFVEVVDAHGVPLTEPVDGHDTAAISQLAIALATVSPTRGAHTQSLAGVTRDEALGPLIFVTAALSAPQAALIAPLAHRSATPILVCITDDVTAPMHAHEDGWRVVSLPPGGDLAAAWSAAADREAPHVWG